MQELKEEKRQLAKKLEEARNPFAPSQSKEYQRLKRELAETEQQLTQARAKQRTDETEKLTDTEKSASADRAMLRQLQQQRRFDSYAHQEEGEYAGIYQIRRKEDGAYSVLFDDERTSPFN